jgi:hypothetical protein
MTSQLVCDSAHVGFYKVVQVVQQLIQLASDAAHWVAPALLDTCMCSLACGRSGASALLLACMLGVLLLCHKVVSRTVLHCMPYWAPLHASSKKEGFQGS